MTERTRIAVPSGLRNVKVLIEDGVFSSIEETDESGKFLMQSGFVDIHTHGAGNIDVNHITSYEEVNQLSRIYASHGVTSFLLSVMTDEEEKMLKIISTLASAYRKGCDGATFAGIQRGHAGTADKESGLESVLEVLRCFRRSSEIYHCGTGIGRND